MGEVTRKRNLEAQARVALANQQDASTVAPPRIPLREVCPFCERDITDRCSVAKARNGAVLFILVPARCPRCGRIIPQVPDVPKEEANEAGPAAENG